MSSFSERPALQVDLVAMLQATRSAERDLFARLPAAIRDTAGADGGWSPKDVLAHLAAWRSIEARRLEATAGGESDMAGDPAPTDPIDESNAALHDRYARRSWDAVSDEADASVEALIGAIERSSTDVLCECDDGSVAGIGANGANHAMGHLTDIAEQAGGLDRFDAFAAEIETILARGHVPPRDSAVILYNIACHRSLAGQLDEARRLLRVAFARRHDLLESARQDPDLAALGDELVALA
jgi:DinB superfamily